MVVLLGCRSDVLAALAELRQDDLDALLVDRAQRRIGEAQAYPAVLALDPELALLQVRHEAPTRPVVGVGNVVAHHRGLSRDLTDSSHDCSGACDPGRDRPEG